MADVDEAPLTMSVPEAGRLIGLKSKDAAYAAARAGQIPVIKVGKLLRVPTKALHRMLDQAGQKSGAAAR